MTVSVRIEGLDRFRRELEDEVGRALGMTQRIQRVAALKMLSGVVQRTPVDTGRLRGGWQIGIGTDPTGDAQPEDDESRVVERERGKLSAVREGRYERVYVANNVDYASIVDEGGFVPRDPEDSPEANKRRAAGRSKAKQSAVAAQFGDPGKPLVRGGFSLQAPKGMTAATIPVVEQFIAALVLLDPDQLADLEGV